MKVFNEETTEGEKRSDVHLLMLTTKEAKVLVEMAEAACEANKRRPSFKKLRKELDARLAVF